MIVRAPLADADWRVSEGMVARTMPIGAERIVPVGSGVELCYQTVGDCGAQPLILIAALGRQLGSWPVRFCEQLADRGFWVVRFDNRDAGRSTHWEFPSRRPFSFARLTASRTPPYRLSDMARDTVGMLDTLGVDSAHVVGISMGATIAQAMAARAPGRVRTLSSLMSTTGNGWVNRPALSEMRDVVHKPAQTKTEAVERWVRVFRDVAAPAEFTLARERAIRAMISHEWDRDPSTEGAARQFAAMVLSGDRTHELRRIEAPTVIVHGEQDKVAGLDGGMTTVRSIPNALLYTVPGLGHDLPPRIWPDIIDLIDMNAQRVTGQRFEG